MKHGKLQRNIQSNMFVAKMQFLFFEKKKKKGNHNKLVQRQRDLGVELNKINKFIFFLFLLFVLKKKNFSQKGLRHTFQSISEFISIFFFFSKNSLNVQTHSMLLLNQRIPYLLRIDLNLLLCYCCCCCWLSLLCLACLCSSHQQI